MKTCLQNLASQNVSTEWVVPWDLDVTCPSSASAGLFSLTEGLHESKALLCLLDWQAYQESPLPAVVLLFCLGNTSPKLHLLLARENAGGKNWEREGRKAASSEENTVSK